MSEDYQVLITSNLLDLIKDFHKSILDGTCPGDTLDDFLWFTEREDKYKAFSQPETHKLVKDILSLIETFIK